ncbi:hypothetical protein [Pelagibacterium limicola]|uniref:hypothetical protein n=1 Tax=Pelagibacterium limicola TaxID=2791022 RepID=UPI0018AF6261|nr:hypothetical protein [Pelagibacterium limicola]
MTLDLALLAATANLAPSVHNTQPTRWALGDGALWLMADLARQLPVGDASGRDLRVSLGAALEGTILALGEQGLSARTVDLPGDGVSARLELGEGGPRDLLIEQMPQRCTWRRGFAACPASQTQALAEWALVQSDITLIGNPAEIEVVSTLNERTSLAFYRQAPYRRELVTWMRLAPTDAGYGADGLSAEAMGMSRFEAFGAGLVLGDPGFSILDTFGLVVPLISEKRRTASAAAVLLFHRPEGENPINTGRTLYRRQLELSALGFQVWPMSVLADDPESAAELSARYRLPASDRLISAWRVGPVPVSAKSRRERLPAEALITT